MFRSILSLYRTLHQMWRDHPFSQRNKTTKGAVRVELEATWKRWLDKILKWGGGGGGGGEEKGGGVGNIRAGGLHKIEELKEPSAK